VPPTSDPVVSYVLVPSPAHELSTHPESASRFRDFTSVFQPPLARSLTLIEAEPAPVEAITAVHPSRYLKALREAVSRAPAYIDHAPTYVTPGSYQAAVLAAGGTLAVVEAVLSGVAQRGFALVRPPGHHATPTRAMGFCLLNNVAIAARRAQSQGLQRVMIVDFDVHHGNGTQEIFEADPHVLYLSTHQVGIYPGTGELRDTGLGPGKGTVVNLPLPANAGDDAFSVLEDQVISPLVERFAPDLLLVSAGFDAHWRDPMAGLQLSIRGFHRLAARLVSLAKEHCEGRIVCVLEGGYDPEVLASGVRAVVCALAEVPPPPDHLGPAPFPEPDITRVVEGALSVHGL
jgi:acetoin utilization deacetylase AcuC-like enzyme